MKTLVKVNVNEDFTIIEISETGTKQGCLRTFEGTNLITSFAFCIIVTFWIKVSVMVWFICLISTLLGLHECISNPPKTNDNIAISIYLNIFFLS